MTVDLQLIAIWGRRSRVWIQAEAFVRRFL